MEEYKSLYDKIWAELMAAGKIKTISSYEVFSKDWDDKPEPLKGNLRLDDEGVVLPPFEKY